jgi:hypothetical protein
LAKHLLASVGAVANTLYFLSLYNYTKTAEKLFLSAALTKLSFFAKDGIENHFAYFPFQTLFGCRYSGLSANLLFGCRYTNRSFPRETQSTYFHNIQYTNA